VASNPTQATFVNVSHAYSSTANPADVPVTISAGKTIDVPISFTEAFAVQHVQVQLNIQYPNDPDLQATLISPAGTRVQLFTHPGNFPGSKANFNGTILDDHATAPIENGHAPFNGTFNPELQLDNPNTGFLGQSSKGTWMLEIEDDGSSSGQLTSWSLTLQQAVPGTGLGEQVADQATVSFRIFTQDPQNALSHDVWTAIGPAGINGGGEGLNAGNTGRIGGLAFDPSDPTGNTAYVGGASGGVWKTTNFLTTDPKGPTYVPLTDFGPTMAINIGSIAVFGRNNDPRQSIVFAATGEGDTGTTGVGFLRSLDGGATWTLLDSTTNVFDNTNDGGNHALDGQFLPINSPLRDHKFVGTTSFKVVVDPTHAPTGPGEVIVYAALSGANGGLWRSLDSGNHWQLMSDPSAEGTNATDVTLAAAEFNQTGNLRVVYAAFEGHGVYLSGQQGANLTLMAGAASADALIQDGDLVHPTPIPVNNSSGASPNGSFGRIVLAAPPLAKSIVDPNTHLPLFVQEAQDPQNEAYSQWLYAAVVNTDGTIHGLFLTKDAGATWTQVHLPEVQPTVHQIKLGIPTNDNSQPDHDPFGTPGNGLPAQGNYDVSLAIDPNNPNVVYLGGADDLSLQPAGGLLRIDTTGIEDAHNLTAFDNSNPDGGLAQKATQGDLTLKNPLPNGNYGVIQQLPDGTGVGTFEVFPFQNTPYLNLVEDPTNPFATNAPILVTGVSAFNNTGQDAHYMPFDGVNGTTDQHRVMAMKDPLTGLTRLVFGDDQGVFSVIDTGSGQIQTGLGEVNAAGTSDVPFPSTSRNGNLQITQFYYGAAQPSILAAEVAGALQQAGGLFYGNAQDDGFPVSDPHLLTDGNIDWNGPTGDGSGIATDQTGSGTAYSYQWPATGIDSGLGFSNFFLVNPNGTGYISRTGTGGFSLNPTDRSQWPLLAAQFGPNLAQSEPAVNPINGDQVLLGSATGVLYRTEDQGRTWFVAGSAAQLDGTYVSAPAYGAPDPADPSVNNLDDFLYAGTVGGNLFVSLNGGANWTKLNGAGNLDGSAVVSVSANPIRGSHEVYVTTLNGVYHVSFSASYPTAAPPVVSNVTWTNNTGTGAGNLFNLTTNFSQTNNGLVPQLPVDSTKPAAPEQHLLSYLSALAVDWRQVIPDANDSGTHPALYVGGNAGVYRSLDNGKTWSVFPSVASAPVAGDAPVDGGYLALAQVTHLDLSVGNVNPTTGQPDQSTGPNVLVATTYGRGEFAIRLDNNSPFNPVTGPRIVDFATVADTGTSNGVKGVKVTFGVRNPDNTITPTSVDPTTFSAADVTITGPNGVVPVTGVQPVAAPDNVYLISFATQTVQGNYSVTVGPVIYDFAGHVMDQDGEGDSTPDGQDSFSASFSITSVNPNGLHVVSATADNLTNPPGMSSITVTFDIPVDPATFHASDVSLTGPNGTVAVNAPTSSAGGTVWTITFVSGAQTTNGNYTLVLSDTIKDTNGHFIDQNENDPNPTTNTQEPGAPPAGDQFTATFTVSPQSTGGGGGGGGGGTSTPLTGPIPAGNLNVLIGPVVPLVRHHHRVPGKFVQTVQVFNIGDQPIQGPIALVLDGLTPPPSRHHKRARVRLLNPVGFTAIGSPFQLAFTGLDPFSPAGAVFMLEYSATSAGAVQPFFRVVSGIPAV
jgi:subtilisin-like proprotein convertase family protein